MNELVLKVERQARELTGFVWPANASRLFLLLVVLALACAGPELRGLVFRSVSDAYLQVTVFVAGTLALIYFLEAGLRFDLGPAMARAQKLQAPFASFLGALPGCGGAIVVITQYTRGYVSFGSVVAVLIATMGDAAFLLIAREPMTGLMMMAIGFTVGTLSGWIVDAIHGQGFMRPSQRQGAIADKVFDETGAPPKPTPIYNMFSRIWILLVVPAGILGLFVATQTDSDAFFGPLAEYQPTRWIGVTGGLLCLIMWATSKNANTHAYVAEDGSCNYPISERIIKDTNFVTGWVILGFLTYELGVYFSGSGIETWLKIWAPFVPLVAILVGFIPGCGPQIVVTSLYLAGAIPLSAQMANAISNDGDALFPAIALAPRAAVVATLYSAIPALIVGYGFYFLFE